MLQSPCFCRGSADLSDSSLERRLASTLLLVSGLKSVIVPQSFNQENVRQEKTRQVKKRSKTIQTMRYHLGLAFLIASQLCICGDIFQAPS